MVKALLMTYINKLFEYDNFRFDLIRDQNLQHDNFFIDYIH